MPQAEHDPSQTCYALRLPSGSVAWSNSEASSSTDERSLHHNDGRSEHRTARSGAHPPSPSLRQCVV